MHRHIHLLFKSCLIGIMVLVFGMLLVVPVYASGLNGTENAQDLVYNRIDQDSLINITWDIMTGTVGPVGNQIYNNRTGGTPNGDLATANAVADFTSWNLDTVQTWDNPTVLNNVWWLKTWQINTADAPYIPYTFLPYGNWPCRNSPAGDVTGQLVYVGMGNSAANYTGLDVGGKIVIADSTSAGGVYTQAIQRGAIGVVNIGRKGAYTPDTNGFTLHPYSSEIVTPGSITYNAANTVPAATVSYDDGQNLKGLLTTQNVTLHLMVDAAFRSGVHSKSVFATINGKDPSKYFLLYGHLNADSYGPGCDDTASGEACIMEIARVMQTLINEGKIQRPDYSIKFFLIGSETQDSRAWINALSPEAKAGIVGSINFDQAGYGVEHDINNIEASDRDLSLSLLRNCKDILAAYPALDPYFQFIDYEGGSDHDAFLNAGIPTCYIWTDWTYRLTTHPNPPEFGGERVWIAGNPYYHTSADVMETTVLREPWNEVNITHLCSLLTARFVGLDQLGFLAPFDSGQTYKTGSVVPLKFQIKADSGGFVTDAVAGLYVDGVAARSAGKANGSNLFRYDADANQYVFNLDTKGMSAGAHTLTVRLATGETIITTSITFR
jgi:hypothetical protein